MRPHKEDEVEIIHRVNRLKQKVSSDAPCDGPGCINPNHIIEAQKVVDTSGDNYKIALNEGLSNLEKVWRSSSSVDDEVEKTRNEIYRYANFVKDMASTYGYELMSYFGESLRDLIRRIDVTNKAHRTIVQAHIDVMRIAFDRDIKSREGDLAKELRQTIEKAINKYHLKMDG